MNLHSNPRYRVRREGMDALEARGDMITITFHVPKKYLTRMADLVAHGEYANRSELIRFALKTVFLAEDGGKA